MTRNICETIELCYYGANLVLWVRKEITSRIDLALASVIAAEHGNLFFYEPFVRLEPIRITVIGRHCGAFTGLFR